MECPNCKKDNGPIVAREDGLFCRICRPSPRSSFSPGLHVKVGNKHYKSMTHIMQQRIHTRRLREDGKIHPDKRFRTKGD